MKGTLNSQIGYSNSAVSGNARSSSVSENRNYASKKKAGKTAKKKLNYNYREISGQILKAKKLQSASVVLSRARSKLIYLSKCNSSGNYDRREVEAAIAHAKRMIRCADMKVNNLREEKMKENATRRRSEANNLRNGIKAAQKAKTKKSVKENERRQAEQRFKKIKQEILEQKRRIKNHRMEEQAKVLDANMRYIKEGGNCNSSLAGDTTAIMELSAMASWIMAQEQCEYSEENAEGAECADIAADGNIAVEATSGGVTIAAEMASVPVEVTSVDISL